MKVTIAFLALLSAADATGSLRGEAEPQGPLPITCVLKGGTSESTCDATNSEDGSSCVWCSLSSYGLCVDESVATTMKQTIPGLTCDDNDDDDDATPSADDDKAPEEDDDVAPSDDSVPDDYWECVEKHGKKDDCIASGCAWCDNNGGYGVCMDATTAGTFDDHVWYTCTMPSESGSPEAVVGANNVNLNDPGDLACLLSSSDESSCEATEDSVGQPCEWCTLQGFPLCVNADQAQIAEQVGGSCGDRGKSEEPTDLDPYDPTCLAVTIQGDESSCKATMDVGGNPCEWCSVQGYDVCMDRDQAELVQQVGGSCGDRAGAQAVENTKLLDPNDPACLFATLQQDESVCKETMDSDGNPCEWCSLQGYGFCMDGDQAQIAEQTGATCDERAHEPNVKLSDPNDPTCLFATLQQDESVCKETMDSDGNSCEWCSLQGYGFCANGDQAQIAEQTGATCDERVIISTSTV